MIAKNSRVYVIGDRFAGKLGTVTRIIYGALCIVRLDNGTKTPFWKLDLAEIKKEPTNSL